MRLYGQRMTSSERVEAYEDAVARRQPQAIEMLRGWSDGERDSIHSALLLMHDAPPERWGLLQALSATGGALWRRFDRLAPGVITLPDATPDARTTGQPDVDAGARDGIELFRQVAGAQIGPAFPMVLAALTSQACPPARFVAAGTILVTLGADVAALWAQTGPGDLDDFYATLARPR